MPDNVTDSNVTSLPIWTRYQAPLTAWLAIVMVLSIFGFLLNLVLLLTIITSKNLRTGAGALIAHAIFLDGLVCFPVIPLLSSFVWTAQYYTPPIDVCRWIMLLFYITVWASNWAPLPVAANRFVAICLPHLYERSVSKAKLPYVILFTWMVSISCSLLLFFGVSVRFQSTKPWGNCGSIVNKPADFAIITAVCTTFPTVLEGVAYIALFAISYTRNFTRGRRISAVEVPQGMEVGGVRAQRVQARRVRSAKMLFAAYVWSTICHMLSPILISTAPVLYRGEPFVPLVGRAVLLLGYATSPVSIRKTMHNSFRFPIDRNFAAKVV